MSFTNHWVEHSHRMVSQQSPKTFERHNTGFISYELWISAKDGKRLQQQQQLSPSRGGGVHVEGRGVHVAVPIVSSHRSAMTEEI